MSDFFTEVNSPAATEHEVSDPADVMQHMANVRNQIRTCTRCVLSSRCSSPTPFRGPAPAPLTIVGEAPGPQEEKQGAPFVGPSGQKLDELLRRTLGFDSSVCLVCNTISCIPRDEPGGKFRAPYTREKEACEPNLIAQLTLADSPWVLVLGRHALGSFRADLPISVLHGRPMWWRGKNVFSTFHPAAALRQKTYERSIVVDLSKLKLLLDNPDANWPVDCVSCGTFDIDWADDYGLYWCDTHAPAHVKERP